MNFFSRRILIDWQTDSIKISNIVNYLSWNGGQPHYQAIVVCLMTSGQSIKLNVNIPIAIPSWHVVKYGPLIVHWPRPIIEFSQKSTRLVSFCNAPVACKLVFSDFQHDFGWLSDLEGPCSLITLVGNAKHHCLLSSNSTDQTKKNLNYVNNIIILID